jgi:hypothetical protein
MFFNVCILYISNVCVGSLSAVMKGFNFGRAYQYKYFYFSVLNAQYFAYSFCSADM